jgi:DNA sulfur modification protein DndC
MPEGTGGDAKSVFSRRSLEDIKSEIQEVYLQDDRPWIIGYSGGKDSTTTIQLVWQALEDMDEEPEKPVYVICSDTLVETPAIVDHINENVHLINEKAEEKGLPISAQKVIPDVEDTFWVNLIGKGYPAPSNTFRWCTDRMKIKPADRFILDQADEHGEVIVVLGTRKQESITRKQKMNMRKIEGSRLSRHTSLPSTFTYTPIEDWLTDDVWTYLLQVPSPWGYENRDLAAMYQTADDECPLVIDTSTPSCGNSRFGCWTCTVVSEDKSAQAMIDSGQEWMEPLLEFRDFLKETQDPERKKEVRKHRRKGGQIQTKRNNEDELVRGPYTLDFCRKLLRKLLKTQEEVRETGPDPDIELISEEELHRIRREWKYNRGDWEDSVPQIYHEVTGERLDWVEEDTENLGQLDQEVLEKVAEEHDVPPRLMSKLLDKEREYSGMRYRSRIFEELKSVLREDWESEEEALNQLEEGNFHTNPKIGLGSE